MKEVRGWRRCFRELSKIEVGGQMLEARGWGLEAGGHRLGTRG